MKLVSIIMPVYNVKNYVRESIQSVQNQQYYHWELIVVNDGSTDGTDQVVQLMASSDSRIKLISQENQGVAAARNTGMLQACGDYIAFLDGDDLWEVQFLASMVKKMEASQSYMAYCGYYLFFNDGTEKHHQQLFVDGDILKEYLEDKIPFHLCSTLVKKEFLNDNNIKFQEGCTLGEDREFIIKIICLTSVVAVSEELMKYRCREGSALHTAWNIREFHVVEVFIRAYYFIEKHYPGKQKAVVLADLLDHIGYLLYRFLFKAIRHSCYNEVSSILNNSLYAGFIGLRNKFRKCSHLMKWKMIESQNKVIWKIVSVLYRAK